MGEEVEGMWGSKDDADSTSVFLSYGVERSATLTVCTAQYFLDKYNA